MSSHVIVEALALGTDHSIDQKWAGTISKKRQKPCQKDGKESQIHR